MNYYNFAEIKTRASCDAHENDEDNFSDITGLLKFYQKDMVSENSHLPCESNKKAGQSLLAMPIICLQSRTC